MIEKIVTTELTVLSEQKLGENTDYLVIGLENTGLTDLNAAQIEFQLSKDSKWAYY